MKLAQAILSSLVARWSGIARNAAREAGREFAQSMKEEQAEEPGIVAEHMARGWARGFGLDDPAAEQRFDRAVRMATTAALESAVRDRAHVSMIARALAHDFADQLGLELRLQLGLDATGPLGATVAGSTHALTASAVRGAAAETSSVERLGDAAVTGIVRALKREFPLWLVGLVTGGSFVLALAGGACLFWLARPRQPRSPRATSLGRT